MTNCKHENITLDDIKQVGFEGRPYLPTILVAECPDCGKVLYMADLKQMGYKLVKEDKGAISKAVQDAILKGAGYAVFDPRTGQIEHVEADELLRDEEDSDVS